MRKIIKNSNTRQTNTFRLHYFPNIPTRDQASRVSTSTPGNTGGEDQTRNTKAAEGTAYPPDSGSDNGFDAALPDDRTQLEAVVKQAYAEGFAQGERDAQALGEQRIAPLVATLENMMSELAAMRQKIQAQIENEVVELALHIARKVIGQEVQTNRSAVAAIVREALKLVEDPEEITIRMNPADIQQLQNAQIDIGCPGGHGDRIQFREDRGVETGGCLVQTEYGEIDARIEEQLRTIEEAFRAESMHLADENGSASE